LTIIYVVKFDL